MKGGDGDAQVDGGVKEVESNREDRDRQVNKRSG